MKPDTWPLRRMATRLAQAAAAAACAAFMGCAAPTPPASGAAPSSAMAALPAVTPALRQALAPTGTLRIGVYPGSPTSMVQPAGGAEKLGLTVEIGRELARRLGVPAELVEFPRVAEVVEALKAGRADFTITNASPARAEIVDFTPTVVALELGVLALPDSPVQAFDKLGDLDRAGVRIGVSQGSTSQGVLAFAQAVAARGLVREAAARAGLRGLAEGP